MSQDILEAEKELEHEHEHEKEDSCGDKCFDNPVNHEEYAECRLCGRKVYYDAYDDEEDE